MTENSVFLDTNVLVYAAINHAPHHKKAKDFIERYLGLDIPLWISCQVIRVYLVVLSKPQTYGKPLSISTLSKDVTYFIKVFNVAEDTQQTTKNLLYLATHFPVACKQLHDANIVAAMMNHQISTLATYNTSDFVRFNNLIKVVTP